MTKKKPGKKPTTKPTPAKIAAAMVAKIDRALATGEIGIDDDVQALAVCVTRADAYAVVEALEGSGCMVRVDDSTPKRGYRVTAWKRGDA
ncbi:hypothetical protein HN371_00250 [Candidatus Poribacteria bacterium]|jgi:hypothetical protein|nr:hypothetical protein [Candidatus Poribacteria bacterium]MBT7096605.1 hypothetical protein [Candidatus Poribacteria bacterium]